MASVEGGLLGDAKEADTPIKAWELFITDHMIDDIVTNTNVKIQVMDQSALREVAKKDMTHVRKTGSVEMNFFFLGLFWSQVLKKVKFLKFGPQLYA